MSRKKVKTFVNDKYDSTSIKKGDIYKIWGRNAYWSLTGDLDFDEVRVYVIGGD